MISMASGKRSWGSRWTKLAVQTCQSYQIRPSRRKMTRCSELSLDLRLAVQDNRFIMKLTDKWLRMDREDPTIRWILSVTLEKHPKMFLNMSIKTSLEQPTRPKILATRRVSQVVAIFEALKEILILCRPPAASASLAVPTCSTLNPPSTQRSTPRSRAGTPSSQ